MDTSFCYSNFEIVAMSTMQFWREDIPTLNKLYTDDFPEDHALDMEIYRLGI